MSWWLLVAVALWLAAQALDRKTVVEVFYDGTILHVNAAGSSLEAALEIDDVSALEIRAADSIDPPGGRNIRLDDDTGTILDEQLPRRFVIPVSQVAPTGDWELDDEHATRAEVWRREIHVTGPFDLRVELTGRFLSGLQIVLEGQPGASIAVRRGLINHDLFIRDESGRDRAVTSIDPTPVADLGSIAAMAARSAAVAALVIACFALLAAPARIYPVPAASRWRRYVVLVLLLTVAAVSLSAWVARDVLAGLPHTPDAVVYLLQAHWLLDGRLWGEVTSLTPFQPVPFLYEQGTRLLPHYPPGWPALLAVGVASGADWLVAPVLGGLFVWLLYLAGREVDGPTVGLLAAVLGVFSPQVRVLFATMLSHAGAATLILASIVLLLRSDRTGSRATAGVAGLCLGLVVAMRPLSAVAAAIPLSCAALLVTAGPGRGRQRTLTVGWFGLGLIVGACPAFVANQLITGSPATFPYSLAGGSMFGLENLIFGLRNLDVLLALDGCNLTGWGWGLLPGPWMIAVAFSFALVPFLLGRARATDVLLAAVAVAIIIAHVGTRGHGLHGFGPRYHFEAVAPILLLIARGFLELARSGVAQGHGEKRVCVVGAIGLFFLLSLPAAAQLPERLELYRGYNGVNRSLLDAIAERELDRAAIVVSADEWQGWAQAMPLLSSNPTAQILILQAVLPDPRIFELAGDRPVLQWTGVELVPVGETTSGATAEP